MSKIFKVTGIMWLITALFIVVNILLFLITSEIYYMVSYNIGIVVMWIFLFLLFSIKG